MTRWRALAQRPALHFCLLGALLLGADRLSAHWQLWPETLIVTADDVARVQQDWQNDTGRTPTPSELRASLDTWLDDEVVLHEALKRELDRSDAVVRRRLLMNLRFVDPEPARDDDTLLREARALGMTLRDTVVRRRLIEVMHQSMVSGLQVQEADVRAYVSAHPEQFGGAARVDVKQRYFSRDTRRGAQADAQACARAPDRCFGDTFLLGQTLNGQSADDLARVLGTHAAQAISRLPLDTWSDPLESPYGWHLFRVSARSAAGVPDYAQVRQRAAYAALADKEKQVIREQVQALRRHYVIEWPNSMQEATP